MKLWTTKCSCGRGRGRFGSGSGRFETYFKIEFPKTWIGVRVYAPTR